MDTNINNSNCIPASNIKYDYSYTTDENFDICNKLNSSCSTINWELIVGSKHMKEDEEGNKKPFFIGGYVNDLIHIGRQHLADALLKGELTETDAGRLLPVIFESAYKEGIQFGLEKPNRDYNLLLLQEQIIDLLREGKRKDCLTKSQCDLNNSKKILTDREADEICKDSARKDCVTKVECELNNAKKIATETETVEIINESRRKDCITDSQCKLNDAIAKLRQCECENSKEELRLKEKEIESKVKKMACDCCNQTALYEQQANLYRRQAIGFDDHANLKLLEIQLQTLAMIFGDTNLEEVPQYLDDKSICQTYSRINSRLNGRIDENGNFIPGPATEC